MSTSPGPVETDAQEPGHGLVDVRMDRVVARWCEEINSEGYAEDATGAEGFCEFRFLFEDRWRHGTVTVSERDGDVVATSLTFHDVPQGTTRLPTAPHTAIRLCSRSAAARRRFG